MGNCTFYLNASSASSEGDLVSKCILDIVYKYKIIANASTFFRLRVRILALCFSFQITHLNLTQGYSGMVNGDSSVVC